LAGVKVDRKHAVGARARYQICHELGRNRRPRTRLAILSRVTEIGNNRCYSPRRGASQRVGHDQHFHQVIIGRVGRRLNDKRVLAADILQNLDEDLHVGKTPDLTLGEGETEIGGNRLGKRVIGVARQNLHVRRFPIPAHSTALTFSSAVWAVQLFVGK
jgi:hypothetical protein